MSKSMDKRIACQKDYALEKFILEGDARAVDSWWDKHGHYGSDHKRHYLDRKSILDIPSWTTDRALRIDIEDRVRELGALGPYAEKCCTILKCSNSCLAEMGVFMYTGMTNRQVLLAAARAMGLEYSDG